MANYSKQREEIIETIKLLNNYPTAEEIYFTTKQKDPAVSRSTVYRNLNMLVKNKVLTQISISNDPSRYEYSKNKKNQGYVVCVKCKKIYNFDYNFGTLKDDIYRQYGIEIFENGIVIKGICKSCKEASN